MNVFIKSELIKYYNSLNQFRENAWKNKLGIIFFENLKESDTTKHIHRFHSYKVEFITQLVECFFR